MKPTTLCIILLLISQLALAQFRADLKWAHSIDTYGGTYASVVEVKADNDQYFYMAGNYTLPTDFNPNPSFTDSLTSNGFYNFYLMKLDTSGNVIWAKGFGGDGTDIVNDLTLDDQGNIYICGFFTDSMTLSINGSPVSLVALNPSFGNQSAYIMKLDASGNILWANTFHSTSANATALAAKGSQVYLAVSFQDSIYYKNSSQASYNYNLGGIDILLNRFNSSGQLIRTSTIGGAGNDSCSALLIGQNQELYMSGVFEDSVNLDPRGINDWYQSFGGKDIFLVRFDSLFNQSWAQRLGNTQSDFSTDLAQDALNNIIHIGSFAWKVDFDASASIDERTSNGATDYFVHKISPNGNHLWVKSFGDAGWDYARSVDIDPNDRIFIGAEFLGTVDFDPDPIDNYTLISTYRGIVVQVLNPNGSFAAANNIEGSRWSNGGMLGVNSEGNMLLGGDFKDSIDCHPDPNLDFPLFSGSFLETDIFFTSWKYSLITSLEKESLNNHYSELLIYPNPSQGEISILAQETINEVRIYQFNGQLISSIPINQVETKIRLSLDQGIYLLEAELENGLLSRKKVIIH